MDDLRTFVPFSATMLRVFTCQYSDSSTKVYFGQIIAKSVRFVGAALVEFVKVYAPGDDQIEHFRCAGCGQFGNLKSLKVKTVSYDSRSGEAWIPQEVLVAENHACVYPKGMPLLIANLQQLTLRENECDDGRSEEARNASSRGDDTTGSTCSHVRTDLWQRSAEQCSSSEYGQGGCCDTYQRTIKWAVLFRKGSPVCD